MSFVTDSILKTALGKIKAWGEGKFVAQEAGKGLSTNDYSTAEKNKLSGIEAGANKYVHPTSHAATMITEDTTHRFVTDTEKSAWNAKASTAVASKTANGLMAADDKTKLDAIASGAQVNKIESVKVNGTALTIDSSKAVNVDLTAYAKKTDIPTKISALTNDSGYQTAAQVTSAINAKLVAMTETELNTMWTEVFGA